MPVSNDHPLHHARYVRSNQYDPDWVARNQMGPHPLWLAESLTETLDIPPGAKVLDLGCGKALSSIFLAKEFGARVWATDLWITASDNHQRIIDAHVGDLVTPIHAEAHALPFADEFFDIIISIDAYQYFGTDDLYLGYITKFLTNGGHLAVAVPSLVHQPEATLPDHLASFWDWEMCAWHSPQWWRDHWDKTGKVIVDRAELIVDSGRDWLRFNDCTAPLATGWEIQAHLDNHNMLTADHANTLGIARIAATVAHRPS